MSSSIFAQSPGGISTSLRLWLKANAGTNCTTNACSITAWNDQSGAGSNVTGAGNTKYKSIFANYNPSLNFTDDVQPLTGTITRTGGTASSMFVVGSISTVADKCFIEVGDATGRAYFMDDRYAGAATYSMKTNVPTVWETNDVGGATATNVFENGKSFSAQTKANTTNWTVGNIYLGDDRTGGNRLTGDVAEIIYYDQQLSAANQQLVESYLAIKYGITLSNDNDGDFTTFESPNGNAINEGDYLNSSGTVLWDASVNSTYHNNVAGIGRDDGSALDQRKSMSSAIGSMIIMDKGSAFTSNNDFILWGSDAASTSTTTVGAHPSYTYRMTRTWKTSLTGTPGNVTVRIIIANSGVAANYALLLDGANTDFSAGATAHTTGRSISGDTITFTGVPLTNGMYFTLGSNVVILSPYPGGIATNLNLWLKANAGTNCTTNACAITSWNDQSGNSNNATGTGNTTYLSSFANYNSGLDFTNDAQPLTGTISRTNGATSTVFVAGKIPVVNDKCLIELGNGTARQYFMDDRFAGNNSYSLTTNTTSVWTASDPGSNTAATIYTNDAATNVQTKTLSTSWTGGTYQIGDDNTGGNQLTGQIAEIIYYDQQLSLVNQQKVETYLAIKYGITLSNDNDGDATTFESPNGNGVNEGDYVSSQDNIIWDASVNSAYHNDIGGIGRDDNSGLSQPKSKSEDADAMIIMNKGGAFTNDRDFILWGNDNGSLSETTTGIYPGYAYRLTRIWKADLTGTPGTVSVSFIYTNSGTVTDYALLLDGTDTDFSSGATAHTTGRSISGDTITFTGVTFTDGMFFTLGTSYVRPYPGGIFTDIRLWLKANAATNCSTNACAITSWTDQSGNLNSATGTGNAVYSTSSSNYNPGITFSDDAQPISGSISRTNGTTSSVFAVGRIPVVNDKCLIEIGTATPRQFFMDRRYAGNTSYSMRINQTGVWCASDPGGVTAAIIYENGNKFNTQTKTNTTNWTTGGSYYMGDDRTGGNQLTGDITEVIYYDSQLSGPNQQKVESYLAIKYGITLGINGDGDGINLESPNGNGINEGDYISKAGTVIWDASVATAAYNNNIIGIGRDDNSGLLQKQSHTQDDTLRMYLNTLAATNSANAAAASDFGADNSFVVAGNASGFVCATQTSNLDLPSGILSRLERKWRVTNTNFTGTFSIDITLGSCVGGTSVTASHLRLLIDDDGTFANSNVYSTADGLTFSYAANVITVTGISTTLIAQNATKFMTIGSTNTSTPLPIKLISFTAKAADNKKVNVKWSTATEMNNDYFTVEKSRDAISFENIATVKGAGNSTSVLNYSLTDEFPYQGTSYYRLKQTDFDGKYTYSNTAAIEFDNAENFAFNIYPNPTTAENINLSFKENKNEEILVVVYDANGKKDFSKIIIVQANGNNIYALDPSHKLSPGVYMVTATSQQEIYHQKLIIY